MKKSNMITILGSGISAHNYEIKTSSVIVSNGSLLSPSIKGKSITWITGGDTGQRVDHYKNIVDNAAKIPTSIVIQYNEIQHINDILKFAQYAKKAFEIDPIFIPSYRPIECEQFTKNVISTGMRCIEIALKYYNEIFVAGIEMGINTNYDDTLIKKNAHGYSATLHLEKDKTFLKSLNKNNLNKIKPCDKSGLKKFMDALI